MADFDAEAEARAWSLQFMAALGHRSDPPEELGAFLRRAYDAGHTAGRDAGIEEAARYMDSIGGGYAAVKIRALKSKGGEP